MYTITKIDPKEHVNKKLVYRKGKIVLIEK